MNTPEIGSKWERDGETITVAEVKKRGRGWQVYFATHYPTGVTGEIYRDRLRDFLKAAKPL